jgi:predicted nucleic acid-binding protein
MKKYIVDASTCLKWIFDDEENVDYARRLLSDYLSEKILLVAPSLWLVEVSNAIKSAVLSKRITTQKGKELLSLIMEAKPKIISFEGYIESAFDNACKYHISVYDSLYLTIALENNIRFITADIKLFIQIKELQGRVVLLGNLNKT